MSLNRNPLSSLQNHFDKTSLQTIDSLPDELLLPIFDNLSSFQRALLLQICKKWNQVILLHTPFWQYLHLSENFSPSSIVKIISIFNERSGCRLKHVILETEIKNVKHLNRIFAQLKRSGSSLNVLALRQERKLNGKTRALAMQHLPVLDSLITHSQLRTFISGEDHMFRQRVRFDIQDQSNVEIGLKFYFTEVLSELTQENLKWLSGLRYFWVVQTDNIMSMRRILETAEHLVELDLPGWTTLEKPTSSTIRSLSLNTNPVCLKSLAEVVSPHNPELTSAMDQMLEIDGEQTLLSGASDSLVMWKVIGLKGAYLHVASESTREGVEILVEKAREFFQLNSTIQFLTLGCYPGGYGGGQHHINRLLGLLDFSFQNTGMIDGEEANPSSGAVDNLLLPHLVKLIIEDPILLDGRLLQKIVHFRPKNRSSHFQLEFTDSDSGKVLVIDDWEAIGWMN